MVMPWEIRPRDGKYCVYKLSDNSLEGCHDTRAEAKDHMSALYASESGLKKQAPSVRDVLEARIHESFTVAADQLFDNGVIDRPTRIELSGLIGTLLTDFGSAVGSVLESVPVNPDIAQHIMRREGSPAAVWKENGVWQWMGIVSNNILDDGYPQHIIAEKAHRFLVSAVDSGFYKEVMGYDAPLLWPWHLPIPFGDTLAMAYDDRGFTVAAGVGRSDSLSTEIFEGFARSDEPLGMSHGVPSWAYGVDPVDRRVINWYFSEEFTVAPLEWAANKRTHWLGSYGNPST